MVLAMIMYFSGFTPEQKTHRGKLVETGQRIEQILPLPDQNTDQRGWQVVLLSNKACQNRCALWKNNLGQIKQALGKDRDRVNWRHAINSSQQPPTTYVWLADPLGNLVLRYSINQPPQDLLKDLKRLLRVSKIG